MDDRIRRRGNPPQREDRTESERLERRQVQAAGELGEVRERVGARVAVRCRVRQRPDSAGVHHDDSRAAHPEINSNAAQVLHYPRWV